jgi:hypothetical protein
MRNSFPHIIQSLGRRAAPLFNHTNKQDMGAGFQRMLGICLDAGSD